MYLGGTFQESSTFSTEDNTCTAELHSSTRMFLVGTLEVFDGNSSCYRRGECRQLTMTMVELGVGGRSRHPTGLPGSSQLYFSPTPLPLKFHSHFPRLLNPHSHPHFPISSFSIPPLSIIDPQQLRSTQPPSMTTCR
jgi:hypothetical protein